MEPHLPPGYTFRVLPPEDVTVIPEAGMTNVRMYMGGGLYGPDANGRPYEYFAELGRESGKGYEGVYLPGHSLDELYSRAAARIKEWQAEHG